MDQATLDKANKLTEEIRYVRGSLNLASDQIKNKHLVVASIDVREPGYKTYPGQIDLHKMRYEMPEDVMTDIKKVVLEHCEQELARLENELASL